MLCQYNRDNIFQIEDLPEDLVNEVIRNYERDERVDCKLPAQEGKRFCIFHDPESWKTQGNRIAEEFMRHLEEGKRVFIGYHFPEFSLRKKEAPAISFPICKFHGSAQFAGNFVGADFYEARFEVWASFIGAKFEGRADFIDAKFKELAWFYKIVFPIRPPSALMVMERVQFSRPDSVRFDGTNLSWFLFLSTDIRKLDFRNATWHSKGGRYVLGVDLDLQETLRIEEEGKEGGGEAYHITSDDVAQAYRDLRANYERHRRYSEARDFFIGEMDALRLRPLYGGWLKYLRNLVRRMRRSGTKGVLGYAKRCLALLLLGLYRLLASMRVHFSLLGFYEMLGEYGESVLHPTIWAIIVIFGFAVFNSSSPIFHLKSINSSYEFLLKLEPLILRSIRTFFQLEQTVAWSSVVERLLGVLLLGLIVIALRRKLERHR